MAEHHNPHRRLSPREFLLCYTMYALLVGLGFLVAFVIWPPMIVAVTIAVTNSRWIIRGVFPFSMLLLGGAWLLLVLAAGSYLRNGIARGLLWQRFMRLAMPLVLAAVLGMALTRLSLASAPSNTSDRNGLVEE